MPKKSYDPDPSSKRSRVPPQLRPWVFGRRKKRTHDPKGMAYGYGKVRGKPVHYGRRGGVAWSGGKTLRYDPNYRGAWGRAKARARGVLGILEANLMWVGVLAGILVPAEVCRAKHGRDLKQYYVDDTVYETKSLFGARAGLSPWNQIIWKFTNPNSTWTFAFWGSLIAQLLTRFNVVSMVSKRANADIKKFTLGTLVASIFGGLFLGGGSPTTRAATATSNPANLPVYEYTTQP